MIKLNKNKLKIFVIKIHCFNGSLIINFFLKYVNRFLLQHPNEIKYIVNI